MPTGSLPGERGNQGGDISWINLQIVLIKLALGCWKYLEPLNEGRLSPQNVILKALLCLEYAESWVGGGGVEVRSW